MVHAFLGAGTELFEALFSVHDLFDIVQVSVVGGVDGEDGRDARQERQELLVELGLGRDLEGRHNCGLFWRVMPVESVPGRVYLCVVWARANCR